MKLVLFFAFCLVNSAKGCDETIEAESGTITSPNYPNNYPNNAECTYTIIVPEGKTVRLTFTAFDIEDDGCRFDYITVNGGGRFCGDYTPDPFQSDSNIMTVRFVSDSGVEKQGFSASFTSQIISNSPATPTTTGPPGCDETIEAESGTITSPDYPNNYPNNAECTYTIIVPEGKTVRLTFTAFDIEDDGCDYDYITVNDGGRFCGDYTPDHFQSDSNIMTVRFVSDSGVEKQGFSGSFTSQIISNSPATPTTTGPSGCDETIEAESGTITSPNYPNNYPNNAECNYTIVVPEGKTVRLTFTAFDIEDDGCEYDYITVNGGGRFCGDYTPDPFQSDSNIMTVRFVSDSGVEKQGFSASFTSQISCDETIEAESGTITSPNYPNNYPYNAECTYTIIVPEGKTVRLTFIAFDIEDDGCDFDYITVNDGEHFCGDYTPYPFQSDSNIMTVRFVSDDYIVKQGFSASFTSPPISTDSTVSNNSPTPLDSTVSNSLPTQSASTVSNNSPILTDSVESNSSPVPPDSTVSNSSPIPLDTTVSNSSPTPTDSSVENSSPIPTDSAVSNSSPTQSASTVSNSSPILTDSVESNSSLIQTDSTASNSSPTPLDSTVSNTSPTPADSTVSNSSPIPTDSTVSKSSLVLTDSVESNSSPIPSDSTVSNSSPTPLDSTVSNSSSTPLDSTVSNNSPIPTDSAKSNSSPIPSDSTESNNSPIPTDSAESNSSPTPTDSTISNISPTQADAAIANSSPTQLASTVPNSSPTPVESTVANSSPTVTDSTVENRTPTDSTISNSSPTSNNPEQPTRSASPTISNSPSTTIAASNSPSTPTDSTVPNTSPTTSIDSTVWDTSTTPTDPTVSDSSLTLVPTESNDSPAPTNPLVEATSTERVTTESEEEGGSSTRVTSGAVPILLIAIGVIDGLMW